MPNNLVKTGYRRAKGVKKGFLLSFRKSRNNWEDQPRSIEKGNEGQFARRYARLLGTVDPRKKSELVKAPLTAKNRRREERSIVLEGGCVIRRDRQERVNLRVASGEAASFDTIRRALRDRQIRLTLEQSATSPSAEDLASPSQ